MGCIYEERSLEEAGRCSLCDENDLTIGPQGCDENGMCCVSDDPDPADSCDSYESDYVCHDCGVDLNVEDCQCETEEDE